MTKKSSKMPKRKSSTGSGSSASAEDDWSDNNKDDPPPLSKSKRRYGEKDTDEYLQRRERNNIAVRKSRDKGRKKARLMMEKVHRLRSENEMLEQKVEILSKELSILKDLFLAHAGTVAQGECVSTEANTAAIRNDHEYVATIKQEPEWWALMLGQEFSISSTFLMPF